MPPRPRAPRPPCPPWLTLRSLGSQYDNKKCKVAELKNELYTLKEDIAQLQQQEDSPERADKLKFLNESIFTKVKEIEDEKLEEFRLATLATFENGKCFFKLEIRRRKSAADDDDDDDTGAADADADADVNADTADDEYQKRQFRRMKGKGDVDAIFFAMKWMKNVHIVCAIASITENEVNLVASAFDKLFGYKIQAGVLYRIDKERKEDDFTISLVNENEYGSYGYYPSGCKSLKKANTIICKLKDTVKVRDDEILKLKAAETELGSKLNAETEKFNAEIQNLNNEIKKLTADIKDRDKQIRKKDRTIERQNSQIEELGGNPDKRKK